MHFIIVFTGILDKKTKTGKVYYEIKWENYENSTWEPEENIPAFLRSYYERTGNKKIPNARVKNSKTVGNYQKLNLYIHFFEAIMYNKKLPFLSFDIEFT